MSTWFYYDAGGQKKGPITGGQLKGLAKAGMITPETIVETENGKTSPASKVKGLTFVVTAQTENAPATPPVDSGIYGVASPFTKPYTKTNPFTANVPVSSREIQQSIPEPVEEISGGSSWQVTLIGIVLILVVGGIGWTILNTLPPPPAEQPEATSALLPLEQAEVDKYISEHGKDVIVNYLDETEDDTEKILKYLEYFISQGANVNAKNNEGWSPLRQAICHNHSIDISQFLIDKGADVNEKDKDGMTLLHQAALLNENVDISKFLVSKGLGVNEQGKNGATPLHYAAHQNKNVEVAKYLVSQGADVIAKTVTGVTPLDFARDLKNAEVEEYFISLPEVQEQETKDTAAREAQEKKAAEEKEAQDKAAAEEKARAARAQALRTPRELENILMNLMFRGVFRYAGYLGDPGNNRKNLTTYLFYVQMAQGKRLTDQQIMARIRLLVDDAKKHEFMYERQISVDFIFQQIFMQLEPGEIRDIEQKAQTLYRERKMRGM